VLGMGLKNGDIPLPPEFDITVVQGTRQRGRPRATAGARERQQAEARGPAGAPGP